MGHAVSPFLYTKKTGSYAVIKYLYVVISDDTDFYLEQAFVSITSLKMRMPNAFVSLLIDTTTETTLIDKRKNILGLVNELKVIEIDARFNKKTRSRWLKTSMRKHVVGDFLYIDCDTIICDDLSAVEDFAFDLGAVLDGHIPLHSSPYKKKYQYIDSMLGFNSSFVADSFFNSGIIFCKNTDIAYSFFDEWNRIWLAGKKGEILIDQPAFNQVNLDNPIVEIGGIWNCQITMPGGIVFLADAKIIHYFTSVRHYHHPYLLSNSNIFYEVKRTGIFNERLNKILLYPKQAFSLQTRLETRRVREIFFNALHIHAMEMKKKAVCLFRMKF